jgi:hypothetical protein
MIYHHSISAAVARDRIQRLIAEAAADGSVARAKTARPWPLAIRSRWLLKRLVRPGTASMRREAT